MTEDFGIEPNQHLGFLLRRAQQRHLALWNSEVSSTISGIQYLVLAVLERRPGIHQRELGDELDLDRSTINALLNRLENNGLVERVQAHDDARKKVLGLTCEGKAAFKELKPRVRALQPTLTEAVSANDAQNLKRILSLMVKPSPNP